jgi:DNA-directed RNA polymerase specialized sigma subunit
MANILNKISALSQDSKKDRTSKDIDLWRSWKRSGSQETLSLLLKQFEPMIQAEVNKWAAMLARPVLETEAKLLAVDAFNTFSETGGAALATHVGNSLKKLSRLTYTHQSLARLPENKRLQYHTYDVGHTTLEDRLGRPPTADELADHLGWSTKAVINFKREAGHKEYMESGPDISGFEIQEHNNMIDLVHHDLAPVQQQIMEHLTGYRGSPILDNQQIMTKMKMTQGQYSYQKRLIEQAFNKAMK